MNSGSVKDKDLTPDTHKLYGETVMLGLGPGFIIISLLVLLGFIFFCIYFIFKQMQFVIQAINLYKDMVTRQDAMIKILKDIRDSNSGNSSSGNTKKSGASKQFTDDTNISKSIAREEKEPIEKMSLKQAQDMYDNGECPECSVDINKDSVRCQECGENLFEYAQRAFKAKNN